MTNLELKTEIGEIFLCPNLIENDPLFSHEKIKNIQLLGYYYHIENDINLLAKEISSLKDNICYFDFNLNDPLSKNIQENIIEMKNTLINKSIKNNLFLYLIISYFYIKNEENPEFNDNHFNLLDSVKLYFKNN